ncbi:hypothetical protein NIES4073_41770 [Kalymmatonema gypsitolerans NIES-4073]|nr:hypothetical protein NIES4073_41770 [Scytonema sp. NIES-4073]
MALIHDSIPDSEICKKATQVVTEISPTSLCNHCIRTFLFGDLLGIRDGLKCDSVRGACPWAIRCCVGEASPQGEAQIANCCIWVPSCTIWV